ncbi:NADP-dependent oxidoreductase [Alicyclobacillus cycloheptanicus]|uniref:NADPH-dependent curcumin reductase CurA n=1 Tax=Alicyclobacillus cycloheptanicus TaxID=1457 RepID=A0ABT9XES7_9BACL|nr:NADP-dependent oxidoreductase [Alicyclobacillus cycloheptanicus]MDQ0188802.1 NADPH-dependent curcumin reductase CurA [Alicyclobacillus cycloheptanicus]WDM00545.1 NADP-dependent oxidoreductase [Alicyclobacillus cycloheptanicus]
MSIQNSEIRLSARPIGMPTMETFQFVDIDMPTPRDGQVVLKLLYLSVDPYMRGRMSDAKSYVAPFEVGKSFEGEAVAQVVESRHDRYAVGDIVFGRLPWRRYGLSDGHGIRKLDLSIAPMTAYLSVLGTTGLTAYFGLFDIGQPKPGETVVVSGAAGAVGMTVGQIAKLCGCRVVGIAGSDAKTEYLVQELGFDAAINYKTQNLHTALKEACPNGVDVYFDNVGGTVTDAVLLRINDDARIPVCGQIALYNLAKPEMGPRLLSQLVVHRALMKGFIVTDYQPRFPHAIRHLASWVRAGQLKYKETIVEGFENVPDAFLGLFRGENIGKQLVKVADPQ